MMMMVMVTIKITMVVVVVMKGTMFLYVTVHWQCLIL
jgi:hypothetical protein